MLSGVRSKAIALTSRCLSPIKRARFQLWHIWEIRMTPVWPSLSFVFDRMTILLGSHSKEFNKRIKPLSHLKICEHSRARPSTKVKISFDHVRYANSLCKLVEWESHTVVIRLNPSVWDAHTVAIRFSYGQMRNSYGYMRSLYGFNTVQCEFEYGGHTVVCDTHTVVCNTNTVQHLLSYWNTVEYDSNTVQCVTHTAPIRK